MPGSGKRLSSRWVALKLVVACEQIVIQAVETATYHQFRTATEFLGMKWSSYQSFSVDEWYMPNLFTGRHRSVSLIISRT